MSEYLSVSGAYCELCGGWMPKAYRVIKGINKGRYMCCKCDKEDPIHNHNYNRDQAAVTDARYHGGLFHRGEW